jgi:uncharacterized protein (TIGR00369 family)
MVAHPVHVVPSAPAAGLARLEATRDGTLPPPAAARLLGFRIRSLAPGEVTFAFEPRPEHDNGLGMLHGGITATLLDTVMGCAVQTLLPDDAGYTTLDLSVRYLRPETERTVTVLATGTVVHAGRRTASAQARAVDADTGKLLATGTSTLLVVQP